MVEYIFCDGEKEKGLCKMDVHRVINQPAQAPPCNKYTSVAAQKERTPSKAKPQVYAPPMRDAEEKRREEKRRRKRCKEVNMPASVTDGFVQGMVSGL